MEGEPRMIDADSRDLLIHTRIETAVRYVASRGKQLPRSDALGALRVCALGQGNAHLNHMIESILVNLDLPGEELADRIQAVIELDAEEEAERQRAAIRAAVMAEEGAA